MALIECRNIPHRHGLAWYGLIILFCLSNSLLVEASENNPRQKLQLVDFKFRISASKSNFLADLKVTKSGLLPIAELSAFAAAPGSDPTRSGFIALSDRDPKLWRTNKLDLKDASKVPSAMETLTDLLHPMGFLLSECIENSSKFCKKTREGLSAQWEGADIDQNQQLWLLQESTESVHIFDADVTKRHTIINLEGAKQKRVMSPRYLSLKDKENTLYEGIHVISNQQFLLAQQLGPSALVLFEIKDNPWAGNRFPQIRTAQATRSWYLPSPYQTCTLSELAFFADSYFLLSPSCHMILKAQLDPNLAQLTVLEALSYPLYLEHAEALLVLSNHQFLVGLDGKDGDQDNVFLLEASSP
ncbi:MAG: hypothetical protein WCI18_11035 [Pseudomonadota bacterium]